jgi:hypothetical protein
MSVSIRIETPWHQQLVDDMVDAYAEWRHACAAVQAAYDLWSDAAAQDELLAFGAYAAALDKEERLSQVYADLVQRVLSCGVIDHERDRPSRRALWSRMRLALSPRRFLIRASSDTPNTRGLTDGWLGETSRADPY